MPQLLLYILLGTFPSKFGVEIILLSMKSEAVFFFFFLKSV